MNEKDLQKEILEKCMSANDVNVVAKTVFVYVHLDTRVNGLLEIVNLLDSKGFTLVNIDKRINYRAALEFYPSHLIKFSI